MADVEKQIEEVPEVTKETTDSPVKKSTDSPVKENTDSPVKETTEKNGSEKVSNTEQKIIQQVEYYFGDANLNRDKFLLEAIGKDGEGWVTISVLLTFKRLSALSTDSNIIADALMKSDNGLVEVSEDKLKIRRHPERPIPEHNEERRKEIMSRTAYVKGFPLDADIDSLLEFFADFEKVAHVNMRKYLDKPSKTYKFKGSVFATFENKEQAEEFIEKKELEYKNNKLISKWQEKYLEEKREEQKSKTNKKKDKKEEEKPAFILPKRSVLYFEGANEAVTRELIRGAVEKVEGDLEIAFIDFSKGDKTGHVRFTEEDTAAKFLEKLEDKKIKLNDDVSLELRTLSEDEELAFLAKAVENMKNRRNHFNQKKGGHHHHHHGRKRRGGNNDRNDEKKSRADD